MNKILLGIISLLVGSTITVTAGDRKRPNVLFIAVDDLRTEINCFGAKYMHTPNLDRLAKMGMLFERAYCQQAICAPSRNSLLTGLRPDAIGIYDIQTFFRKKVPDVITLPQHFKNNGYHTEAMGKIYHTGHGNSDDRLSWSIPKWNQNEEINKLTKISRGDTIGLERDFPSINNKRLPWYCSNAPEENMTDAMIANHAVKRIEELKDSLFFLAVGFLKPHLPFVAQKKYWDLYDPKDIRIPKQKVPRRMPELALHQFGELRKYYGIPAVGTLDNQTSRNLIHGYYAAVSMIDSQVGKLLNALEKNGLAKNTIIVLWGDHGWKLGDYGSWCKQTNFEMDTNAPLIISVPWMQKGLKTNSLAEFVDIYPTLCDLTALEKPKHLEGQSLLPILENPKEVVAVELYDLSKTKVAKVNLTGMKKFAKKLDELNQLMDEELSNLNNSQISVMKSQNTKSTGKRRFSTHRNSLSYFENREVSIAFNHSSLALQ